MKRDLWYVRPDPVEYARLQQSYSSNVAERARELAIADARSKDAAARRALEQAFATGLADMLRATPDLFADTALSPATVDDWASRFAAQIS